MTLDVVVTPEAEFQIRSIRAWWIVNRPTAPALFLEELASTFDLLARASLVGHSYPHQTVHGVRRLLLRATRYHVYYQIVGQTVVVLAVWHANRGAGPDLIVPNI